MKWLEVWNVISESIVQKHQNKSLYCNRQALEKKAGLSLFSREAAQLMSKLSQKLQDEELKAPKFSIAMGWNIWSEDKLWYFSDFRSATISATAPTPLLWLFYVVLLSLCCADFEDIETSTDW